jgi:hypothetical protein
LQARLDHFMVTVQFPLAGFVITSPVSLFESSIVLNGPSSSRVLTVMDRPPPSAFLGSVTVAIAEPPVTIIGLSSPSAMLILLSRVMV